MAPRLRSTKMPPSGLCRALFFFCLVATSLTAQQVSSGARSPHDSSNAAIIQGIDNAVRAREAAVTSYTVQDHYAIYRNGGQTPASEMTVQTVYQLGQGKSFTTVAESGSSILRSAIIEKILDSEKEMSGPAVRDSVLIDSANYEFSPEPGTVQRDGHTCIVVGLQARRKSQHLFNGKAWIDASDDTVVRLEGTPAASPSFFAGATTLARRYDKIDGYPMAVHAEAHSHSFLLGDTDLKIDSTQYQITLAGNVRATTAHAAP